MCGKVLLKRMLPFFLTFAVGLFIASFFVTVAAPSFQFNRGFRRHEQYHRMMEFENQRLREDNLRLERQLADNDLQNSSDVDVPSPLPIAPAKAQTIPYRVR